MNECDDNNLLDGDGCSSKCLIEAGWECKGGSPSSRDTCIDHCGDSMVKSRPTSNYCDDNNNDDWDGCSSKCVIEKGF